MADNDFVGAMGWLIDEERRDELIATASTLAIPMLGEPPEEIDPRPYHRVENQGQQGSCQGHDISSCVEHCHHIATGEVKQYSRAHGYYGSQRIDGLLGRDQGSTISGGVELTKTVGLVSEEEWPYPPRYNPNPPVSWEKIAEMANPFRIKSHMVLRSYEEMFNYLATGQGAISTGTAWGFTPNSEGVVERYSGGSGGHATAVLGYSRRKDSRGRRYLWLLNSWGTSWGNGGWAEVSPSAWDSVVRNNYTVIIGVSDLSTPVVRPIDWTKKPII